MSKRGFYFARKRENGEVVMENGCEVQAFPNARLPEYSTENAAGADFFCAEAVVIPSIWVGLIEHLLAKGEEICMRLYPGVDENNEYKKKLCKRLSPTLVHTGIKASMYDDEVLELYNRSSNPSKLGLVLANSVGVVDADYFESENNDGEIMFAFYNFFPFSLHLKVGDKIGQGVFKKFLRPEENCIVCGKTRKGGFGSTDN